MGLSFIELLKNSESVTNVTIICCDGVIYSHKIILASVSDFVKHLIDSIPSGDDITLLLPSFTISHVQELLSLCGTSAKTNIFGSMTTTEPVKTEVFQDNNDHSEWVNSKIESIEDDSPSMIENPLENDIIDEQKITNIDHYEGLKAKNEYEGNIQQSSAYMNEIKEKAYKLLNFYESSSQMGELIENPKTKAQIARNKMIQQQFLCKKALEGLVNGDYPSVRSAAMDYGVCPSFLSRSMNKPTLFAGKGKRGPLTPQEEQHITKVALERIKRGLALTSKELKHIIEQEVERIKLKYPERNIVMSKVKGADENFVRHFADRNDLKKYLVSISKKLKKEFECDVCFKGFTMKNSMDLHQKTVHYSFLQNK